MGLSWPILSVITYIPLLGALIIMLLLRRDNTIRWFANLVVIVDFLVSLRLLPGFIKDGHVIQYVEKIPWIESLGVQYFMGVDGISILLVMLTTFLGILAVLSSWTAIQERVKEYYIFMLLLQTGMLGVFFSLDFFLFYVFWEIMLVPMYFLIGVWGGPRKLYAAIKFFLYTLAGSVLMLLAIITLWFLQRSATGEASFEIMRFYGLDIGFDTQKLIFLAFFVAFAIKVPMFPFHTWLPDAHVEAPTAGSVILAGVLLCGRRDRIWRPHRNDAAGYEEARCVFEREPPRFRDAGRLRAQRPGGPGRTAPDDKSRPQHGGIVLARRHYL